MQREGILVSKICFAQLAHQRTTQDRFVSEASQFVSCYLVTWDVGTSAGLSFQMQDAISVSLREFSFIGGWILHKVFVQLEPSEHRLRAVAESKD